VPNGCDDATSSACWPSALAAHRWPVYSRPVAAATARATSATGTAAPTAPGATATAIRATASNTRAAATPGAGGKLPSPAPSVPDAYLTPPPSFKSVPAIPGRGAKIAVAKASQQPPPTPRAQNAWWQKLEKGLGSTMNSNLILLP